LDQNTLEVIRIAYKNYPLPNKKTKIVFYVTYSIY
jgi:outer membrane biosynthesis protein TonB